MTPAFAVVEALAALLAAGGDEDALAAVCEIEEQMRSLATHVLSPRRANARAAPKR